MRLCRYILSFIFIATANNIFSQEQGSNINDLSVQDLNDRLIIAADKGDTVAVLELIARGANVNAATYEGVTPLMYAAQNGDIPMIGLLMQHKADAGLKPYNGYTALITAIRNGNIQAAELLIRNGADINLPDHNKVTPLMHAIAVDSFYLPDMLLYYDAPVDPKNKQGTDALMLACWYGQYEIAVNLLEAGADINTVDAEGNTPLHYSTYSGNTDLMDLLVVNGASLEMTNSAGYTPLALAVSLNNYNSARLLIGYGADVNSRINGALNPLTLAIHNKNDSLAKMLVNQDAKILRRPFFNQLTIGTRYTFNSGDSQVGFSIGLSDSKYNLMTGLDVGFRPKAIQVFEEPDPDLFYQYWEKRRFISLSLDKAFFLHTGNSAFSASVFAGFSEALTFGSYRGSNEKPDLKLLFNPRIGWIFDYRFLRLKVSYSFMNLQPAEINNGWFNFLLEFRLNRKKGNNKAPSIKWL